MIEAKGTTGYKDLLGKSEKYYYTYRQVSGSDVPTTTHYKLKKAGKL